MGKSPLTVLLLLASAGRRRSLFLPRLLLFAGRGQDKRVGILLASSIGDQLIYKFAEPCVSIVVVVLGESLLVLEVRTKLF